jgi:hypothetical protein
MQVLNLSEAPSPPMNPHYPPFDTVYVCTVYLFTQGELTREKVRGAIVQKAGRLIVSPVYEL